MRRTDYEFLTSPRARDLVREEGIVLTDYGPSSRPGASPPSLLIHPSAEGPLRTENPDGNYLIGAYRSFHGAR